MSLTYVDESCTVLNACFAPDHRTVEFRPSSPLFLFSLFPLLSSSPLHSPLFTSIHSVFRLSSHGPAFSFPLFLYFLPPRLSFSLPCKAINSKFFQVLWWRHYLRLQPQNFCEYLSYSRAWKFFKSLLYRVLSENFFMSSQFELTFFLNHFSLGSPFLYKELNFEIFSISSIRSRSSEVNVFSCRGSVLGRALWSWTLQYIDHREKYVGISGKKWVATVSWNECKPSLASVASSFTENSQKVQISFSRWFIYY